jgi:hypothetical protein
MQEFRNEGDEQFRPLCSITSGNSLILWVTIICPGRSRTVTSVRGMSNVLSGVIFRMTRYFRFDFGTAFQSHYCLLLCCLTMLFCSPAGSVLPIQLYSGRQRMKMYFRSWGRHRRSLTLPRTRRAPLMEIDTGQ